MSTIALELISAMIKMGDTGPLLRGEFRREHCTDTGSETLFDFITNYRRTTDGAGRVPAMTVIKDRFPHIVLPETSEVVDLEGLVYEARSYKTRMRIQTLTNRLVGAIEAIDPIAELRVARAEFDDIMKDASSNRDMNFSDVALELLDDYSGKMLLKHGIPWPWDTMTAATQGMQGGEFYIIAGRPKSRKTFIALFIAAFLVRVLGLRVLFVSPEMGNRQVMIRFMAFTGQVPYAPFKEGELTEEDENRLYEAISKMMDADRGIISDGFDDDAVDGNYSIPDDLVAPKSEGAFIVTKATGQPVSFIESKIKEHRPHVVIVDSFYRLNATGSKGYDSDWKAVTAVSRSLKDMAMEQNIVLIGTHQLNRDADEKIGSMANLGYSDAIGQDCDMAIRVITAKRPKIGDRSALLVLGARETPIEGVLIHNEPCNNFSEIEPLLSGNRKKLLEMMMEEDAAEELAAEQSAAAAAGLKKGHAPSTGFGAKKAAPTATKISATRGANLSDPSGLPAGVDGSEEAMKPEDVRG